MDVNDNHFLNREQSKLLGFFLFPVLSILINRENLFTNAIVHLLFYLLIAFILLCWMDNRKKILLKVSKIIIVLHFANIMITMFLANIGGNNFLPEIICRNLNNSSDFYGFALFRFGIQDESYRYCGFAAEPSHLAIFLTAAILSIIYFHTSISRKQLWLYVLLYTITILLSGTSYGVLYMILTYICICQKILLINLTIKEKIVGVFSLCIIFIVTYFILQDNIYLVRLRNVISAIFNSSFEDTAKQISLADLSAYARIGPFILFFSQLNYLSVEALFGNGYDGLKLGTYFANLINFSQDSFYVYFLPAYFYSCGLLGAGYVLYFIFSSIKKLPFIFTLFVLLCLTNINIPTPMFWFIIIQMIWIVKANQFENQRNISNSYES
jgi:hypothetical protein